MRYVQVVGSSRTCLRQVDVSCGFVVGSEGFIVLKGGQDPLVADSLGGEHAHLEAILRSFSCAPEASGRLAVSSEGGGAGQARHAVHPGPLIAQLDGDLQRLPVVAVSPLRITPVERQVAEGAEEFAQGEAIAEFGVDRQRLLEHRRAALAVPYLEETGANQV